MIFAVITIVSGRHDHLRLQLAGLVRQPSDVPMCTSSFRWTTPRRRRAQRRSGPCRRPRRWSSGVPRRRFARPIRRCSAATTPWAKHPDALFSGLVACLPPAPEGGHHVDESTASAPSSGPAGARTRRGTFPRVPTGIGRRRLRYRRSPSRGSAASTPATGRRRRTRSGRRCAPPDRVARLSKTKITAALRRAKPAQRRGQSRTDPVDTAGAGAAPVPAGPAAFATW
jgi:hypothetical protein